MLSVPLVGNCQDNPLFVLRMTSRFFELHAHTELPNFAKSAIGACILCTWYIHVAPPSALRRMKPPPPASHTESGEASTTLRTSACCPMPRSTGVKLAPEVVLLNAAPFSPTTQTEAPFWSTDSRSFTEAIAACVHVSPPSVVRSKVPSSPAAQPFCASVNASELRRTLVPLGIDIQLTPALVVRRMVPSAPATNHTLSAGSDTARMSGEPFTIVSVQ